MRRFVLALLLIAAPMTGAASAQTWPGWPAPPPRGYDPQQAAAEQHRQAIEQLRLEADRREIEARQNRLESALTVQRLQAARAPLPASPPATAYAPAPAVLPAPADQTARGVDEIDAWLARRPH
ncbi:hypothetical protein D8I30_02060 [Brevundimonas naejangsanensis]|uniref:Uncharacterized protein n=1 Tax=Brevundimonas naejangsanensis TaxID=588932 RepID=A0A494RG56_9CAUL|nr:hypothetical protein [Brevundimonas naejangsanensis]AYG94103.1 hypothetical protein D8I30_02060 [Brevundimonas naejangsanensis]